MASTELTAVSGRTLEELIDSIERQRKDIEFLLAHLDDDNILKLGGGKVTVGDSTLSVWSNQIQLQVTENTSDIASAQTAITQNANDITLKAAKNDLDNLTGRVSTAESNITQNANNIALKVSQTDYNGNTIASLINQSATTITLSAEKIDLLGITKVASTIQLGNTGDTGMKAIQFRGYDTWVYDDASLFSIDSNKQIRLSSTGGYLLSSIGNLTAANMGLNFNGTQTTFINSTLDFSGSYTTGLYAVFG